MGKHRRPVALVYAHPAQFGVLGGSAEEHDELDVGEALAIDFGMQQGCCDVVAALRAFASREFPGVGEHLRSSLRGARVGVAGDTTVHDFD
jgi:hypothetical protein